MSDKGVSVKLNADESGFVKAVKNSEESLEDLQKGLDDLTKDGADNVEKLEEKFSDTIRTVKDLGDASESSLRKAKRGTDDASDGMRELKDESNSTAKEAAASFDGSAESIIDAFQEVSAQAFAGFGPAGAIAGLAAAAGIGIAVSAFEALQEEQQKAKEAASELADEFISAGKTGSERLQIVVDQLTEMATATDDTVVSLADIQKAAEKLGVPFKDLAVAYAGGIKDIDKQIDKLEELRQAEVEAIDIVGAAGDKARGLVARRYNDQIEGLEKVRTATESALQMEEDYYAAGVPLLQAKTDAIAGINDAYDDTVNSVLDYVDAESGVLDVDAYLAAIEARRQALVDYQKNLVEANLTDEQKAALNNMGQEAAAAFLEAYVSPNTTDDQKRRLAASLSEASKEASGVAMSQIDKAFEGGVETKLKLDTSDAIARASADLRNWTPDEKTLRLRLDIVDRYGQPIP